MADAPLAAHLAAAFAALAPAEREGLVGLHLLDEAPVHAAVPALWRVHGRRPAPGGGAEVCLFLGSARALEMRPADLEAALYQAVREHLEDGAAERALPDDAALFRAQAAWRRGEDPPPGWYRRGERLAEGAWAVDLDLYVEVALPVAGWLRLRGTELRLDLGGDEVRVEVPEPVALDEIWTAPGAGRFEPDPDLTLEDLAEAREADAEVPGIYGDLHLVPIAYDLTAWRPAD